MKATSSNSPRSDLLKLTLVLGVAVVICAFAYTVGYFIAPGSYPYAELYKKHAGENQLIAAAKQLKAERAELAPPSGVRLPNGVVVELADQLDQKDLFHSVYFYLPAERALVHTYVRGNSKYSTLAFISINTGLTLGNWQSINHDLSREDNQRIKQEFEREIMTSIQALVTQ